MIVILIAFGIFFILIDFSNSIFIVWIETFWWKKSIFIFGNVQNDFFNIFKGFLFVHDWRWSAPEIIEMLENFISRLQVQFWELLLKLEELKFFLHCLFPLQLF